MAEQPRDNLPGRHPPQTPIAIAGDVGRRAWAVIRAPLLGVAQVFAALLLLFEEWGWRPLVAALGRLSRYRPIAALELWIAGLPPWAALVAFALPTTVLLPLKFVAMWLLANGQVLLAGALFLGAKVVSTALIARIFILTKPALMQIGWFARAYNWFMPWKEHLFAIIRASWVWRYGRMIKTRIKLEAKQAWARWKPALVEASRAVRLWLDDARNRVRVLLMRGRLLAKPAAIAMAKRTREFLRRLGLRREPQDGSST